MHEAILYQKLPDRKVKCGVCQRRCLIGEGQSGFCQTRLNKAGKLYTLLYGLTSALQIDPIEKKPFYHFKPGTLVASLGSYGCNFRCKQCLNWYDSWQAEELKFLKDQKETTLLEPKTIVQTVIKNGYPGIAFTYNEPTIWLEYVIDIAKLAKKNNLYTVFVTNGFWTKETIDKLTGLIDAANIDLKGFSAQSYQKQGAFFGEIPQNAVYAKKKNLFLEITTLLIPGINDKAKEIKTMTNWLVKNLGPDIPWHLSQFDPTLAPDQEFQKIPFTSIEQLEEAAEIGKNAGLNHIYLWAPTSGYAKSDTFCPKCKKKVVQRDGWQPLEINITPKGNCQFCCYNLNFLL